MEIDEINLPYALQDELVNNMCSMMSCTLQVFDNV